MSTSFMSYTDNIVILDSVTDLKYTYPIDINYHTLGLIDLRNNFSLLMNYR